MAFEDLRPEGWIVIERGIASGVPDRPGSCRGPHHQLVGRVWLGRSIAVKVEMCVELLGQPG